MKEFETTTREIGLIIFHELCLYLHLHFGLTLHFHALHLQSCRNLLIFEDSKWQHELARYYKRGKLVSYFLNNAAKTRLYGLKISEIIEIGHLFQSRAFFHLSSNLHTRCLSAFNLLDLRNN